MFIHSKKTRNELYLVLDIQSSLVRSTLVHYSGLNAPALIWSENQEVSYKQERGSSALIEESTKIVGKSIESALKYISLRSSNKTEKNFPKKISQIHFVLSSPWSISQAKNIHLDFKENKSANRKFVLGMIETERKKMVSGASAKLQQIEEKIFDVRLNGYSVEKWENRKTPQLEVSYVISLSDQSVIKALETTCAHIVSHKNIFFHSSLLLQYVGMMQCMPLSGSCTIMHVHGEITDVLVVERDLCSLFGTYPIGVFTILRAVSQSMNIEGQTADSFLSISNNNHADQAFSEKINPILNSIKENWVSSFLNIFKQAGYIKSLPKKIILSARNHEDFFVDCLRTNFPDTNIHILNTDDIEPHVTFVVAKEGLRLNALYAVALQNMDKS